MAVEIPVVIDIEKAFQDAAERVSTAMKPLQEYVDSEALKIRLQIDENSKKNLGSILKDASLSSKQLNTALSDVERRLQKIASRKGSFDMVNGLTEKENQLLQTYTVLHRKITGIGDTSTATQKIISLNIFKVKKEIDTLKAKLKTVDKGSTRFNNLNNKLVAAKQNLSRLNVELAKVSTQNSFQGLESSLTRSNSRLVTLLKNSARLIALHTATSFIRNVREVTAEFELQRVALGGIIQDTEEANSLFRRIKAAAIESPFQIKDLVSYTKQLSAYRVETEDLFDVTMRLADVSAGLGVDMSRLILAYGQVRAASVLRGQELRQFTEAGIPLVDLLAKKFTELNGKMVSTGDVFELISKRAVPFEMIAEIFEDMTSKGGTFYKMQEKQAETLAGQWANLKDAVSIMYDEIGNTASVHRAMESLIAGAKNLMLNWRSVAEILKVVGAQFLLVKAASLFLPVLAQSTKLAEKSTVALARAEQLEAMQQVKSNAIRGITIKQLKSYSIWMGKASVAQTMLGRGVKQLVANFLGGGWIGLATTALSVLVGWFIAAKKEANRLNKEIEQIGVNGKIEINRSVANFKQLAKTAVEAADGSQRQVEALEELQRTYGDIIPSEQLQIKHLRELEENYDSLTAAIEQKINMQIKEQKVNAITDTFSKKIQRTQKSVKADLSAFGLSREQANAVMGEIQKSVEDGLISVESTAQEKAEAFREIIKNLTGLDVDFSLGFTGGLERVNDVYDKALGSLSDLTNTYAELNSQIKEVDDTMAEDIGSMGVYAKQWDDLKTKIKEVKVDTETFGKKTTFTYKKEKIRQQVELMADSIEEAFEGTNIDISPAFKTDGLIDFNFLKEVASSSQKWGLQSFVSNVQKSYEDLIPTNRMVGVVERKFQDFAAQVGLSMDDVQGYLLRGEKDMKDYTKEISSSLDEAKHKVLDYQKQTEDAQKHPGVALPVSDKDVDNANKMVEFLTLLTEWLMGYAKQNKGGHQTDPWITNMQERIKFMQDFKKGYDDLSKYISSTAALEEEAGVMLGRGAALGLSAADQKRAAEDLSKWYEDMIKATSDRLRGKGLVGATVTDLLGIDTTKRSKDIQELQKLLQSLWDAKTDFDISQKKKDLDNALQKLTDEIKRSETARDFYNNILDLTGDEDLAASVSVSVYGGIGQEFKERMQTQLNKALESVDASALSDELRDAFSNQDFKVILDNLDKFPEKWQETLKQMAADSDKFNAERAQRLLKDLQKAKTYSEKRIELAERTARRQEEIEAMAISDAAKKTLSDRNAKKEAEDLASLQYEAFKNTPMYVEMFADLDAASADMLSHMRRQLEQMKSNWKDLHPRELKELQSRLNELDSQLANRNPFKALYTSVKNYIEMVREMPRGTAEGASIYWDSRTASEKELLDVYTKEYEAARDLYGENHEITQDAKERMQVQADIVTATEEQAENAENTAVNYRQAAKAILDAAEGLKKWNEYLTESLDAVGDIVHVFSSDDFSDTFDTISDGIGKTAGGLVSTAAGVGKIMAGDVSGIVDVLKGIADVVIGIFGTAQELKLKRIDKELKRQDDLLEDLSYSYDRLGEAMERAFGSDYIYNYTKQLENLNAQLEAYNKQADLEREKGKKADEDKIKEYENNARDAQKAIEDMSGQLAEFFSGTDLTSAAQDFANAWIEAYKEFGSTTDAMKEKFNEMIENMVVNSLAAALIQDILDPVFRAISDAAEDGELSAQDIGAISAMLPERMRMINDSMGTLMNQLTAAGVNLRQQVGSFTGISRSIAGASEESINGLAAGINTQNFYMSLISQNVAAILAAMTGEQVEGATGAAAVPDTYKEQMLVYAGSLPQMRDDMASIRAMLSQVIKPRGVQASHYVATNL